MPNLRALGRNSKLLTVVADYLSRVGVDLGALTETRQVEFTAPQDGTAYFVTLAPLRFDNWIVATVIPASDFLATIERNAKFLVAALALLTLVIPPPC